MPGTQLLRFPALPAEDVAALDACHQAQVLVCLLPSHLRGSPSALGLHRGTGGAHTEGG